MKKKILSIILTLAMVTGLVPAAAIGTAAADTDTYLEFNTVTGEYEEKDIPTEYYDPEDGGEGGHYSLGYMGKTTWYVADESCTFRYPVTALGDMRLIVCNGVTVEFVGGLLTENDGSITVYAQSNDADVMGTVTAEGVDYSAAIGSDFGSTGGSVYIHGGNINATAGDEGAGIGAGNMSKDFNTYIYGGNIIARGVNEGAAVGAGVLATGNSLTILGGNIYAVTTEGCNAVGAGTDGSCTIDGDLCHFEMLGKNGEALRSLEGRSEVTLTYTETVCHKAKTHYPRTGAVLNDDGSIKAYGHKEYYECYCGEFYEEYECTTFIDNVEYWKAHYARVFEADDALVTFDLNYYCADRTYITETVSPPVDYQAPAVPVRDGYSFAGWYKDETCPDDQRVSFPMKIVRETKFYAKWIEGGYYTYNSTLEELEYSPLPENMTRLTSSMTTIGTDGETTWYFADTSFESGSRLSVLGNVHLILKNGVTVNYKKGIGVEKNYRGIAIFAQSLDPDVAGTLIATGGTESAGIGSGNETECGMIWIYSGNVIAKGNTYGAGIGGGDVNRGGFVEIFGGNITATGGDYGAGIGTGDESVTGTMEIIIKGGTINAQGGKEAAGIGGGNEAKNFTVEIYDGTITANGGNYGAGIGSGDASDGGKVIIYDCILVKATGGGNAAGIGSGNVSKNITVDIRSGVENCFGGYNAAGIGSGKGGSATVYISGCRLLEATAGSDGSGSDVYTSAPIGAGKGGTATVRIATCVLSHEHDDYQHKDWITMSSSRKHEFDSVIPRTPPLYDDNGIQIIENGCREYYRCKCGMYFKDRECTQPIGYDEALAAWKLNEGIDNDSYPVYFHWVKESTVDIVAADWGGRVKPVWPSVKGSCVVGWYTDQNCTEGNEFDFSTEIHGPVHLYAKWIDNYYLDYDEASHELVPVSIPSDVRKITYSGTGDLRLNGSIPGYDGSGWYYVDGVVKVDGSIELMGDINLILLDGSKLSCESITSLSANLNLYGQSKKKSIMGALECGYDELCGVQTGSFNIYGGYVNIYGHDMGTEFAFPCITTGSFGMYGGYMDLTGGTYQYISSRGDVTIIDGRAMDASKVYVDNCMLDVYGDGIKSVTIGSSEHTVNVRMKDERTHVFSKKTEKVPPTVLEDGTVVDGVREYYTCYCGFNYTDESLTRRIADLEEWKEGSGKLVGVAVIFDYCYDDKTVTTAITAGETAVAPEDVERELYDLTGWYDGNGNKWNFSTKIYNTTTLFAGWKLSHVHNWSDEWTFDEAYHWHACENEGCPVTDVSKMDAYGEHIMENFVCTVCGREDLDGAKEYAYGVIDAEVSKCPSEVHMAEAVEMGEAAKASVALCETVAQVYEILDNFAEQMIIPTYTVTYFDENGEEKTVSDYRLLKDSDDTVLTLEEGKWYVAESSVTVGKVIAVSGDVHIILRDAVTVTAEKGIAVSEKNALTVYSESLTGNMGALVTSGKSCAAGIGGYLDLNSDEPVPGGTVVINGGNITARGGLGAAGIGGGFCSDGGDVIINNGYVAAYGNAGGAGIGGGHYGANGTVTVNGGTVEAYGADDAAGIGGGYAGEGGTVTVNGVKKLTANGFRGIGAGKLCAASAIVTDVDDALIVKAGENAENAVVVEKLTEEEYIEIILDLIGDVNRDGKVNILDVNLVTTMILGRIMEAVNADLDGDGKVNAKDINLLKKIVLGMK